MLTLFLSLLADHHYHRRQRQSSRVSAAASTAGGEDSGRGIHSGTAQHHRC